MATAGPSRSPEPSHKSRHNLTPSERQAEAVTRLLSNPDREIHLPNGPKEKTLRAPREMMKNVSGSSAGAGSGEFHVYKHARRREYERIKLMEDQAAKERSTSHFMISQAEQAAKDEAKTSKNRAKRDKKKLAKEKARLRAERGDSSAANKRKRDEEEKEEVIRGPEAVAEKKVKAAPGAEGLKFVAKGSDDEADEQESEDEED